MIKIHMLPAKEGDFMWLEYGEECYKSHILVDGGVSETGNIFAKVVEYIYSKNEYIEALILTHIDYDHIQGVIEGLEKLSKDLLKRVIKRIVFNTSEGIEKAKVTKIKAGSNWEEVIKVNTSSQGYGVGEAISLIALLKKKELIDRLIDFVVAGEIIDIAMKAKIKVISPGYSELEKLVSNWEEYTCNHDPVAYASNFELSEQNLTDLKHETLLYDCSVNNRSSIAFIFEYNNSKIVFLGDSIPSVCLKGLQKQKIVLPYNVDAVKISHHGSRSNTSDKLLAALPTQNYLISTNGKGKKVPSKIVLAHILKCSSFDKTRIYCNYKWWELEYSGRYFTAEDKRNLFDENIIEITYIDSEATVVSQEIELYGRYRTN